MDFQKRSPFESLARFYVTINGNFEHFQHFYFETNFLKNGNPFKNLEYCFLVESNKIENATFPCKTAL